jgi:hypothetical protein
MRISDVFTMGGDLGNGYSGSSGSSGSSGYGGYRCYGDYGGDCFSGSRPFRAPIQVGASFDKEDKGGY